MTTSEKTYCPQCGAEQNPEDRFCGDCGTAIEAPPQKEEVSSPVSNKAAITEPTTKPTQSKPKISKRLLRILVVILLPFIILLSYGVILENGDPGSVRALAISPDGSLLASGGSNGKVMVWQLPEMDLLFEIEPGQAIQKLIFDQKGGRLVVADSKTMAVYAISGNVAKKVLTIEDEGWLGLCLDGESLYGLNVHGELKIWNQKKNWSGTPRIDNLIETMEPITHYNLNVRHAAFSLDCRKLVVLSSSDRVNLYHVKEETLSGQKTLQAEGSLVEEPSRAGTPEAFAFSSDGKHLAILNDYYVSFWDYASKRRIKKTQLPYLPGDVPLVVDKDMKHAIVGWGNGTIEFLDMETGQPTATFYHGPAWYRMIKF